MISELELERLKIDKEIGVFYVEAVAYPIKYRDYFDFWWNPDKFDWMFGSFALAKYCSRHFTKWWDPEKFYWYENKKFYKDEFLLNSVNYKIYPLDIRSEPHYNPTKNLIQYCGNYIDIWWKDRNFKINDEIVSLLQKYCSRYIDVWGPDVVGYFV